MNGYMPNNPLMPACVAAMLAGVVCGGFLITRIQSLVAARIIAWLLVAGATFAVERLSITEPVGIRMLVIIAALLWSMKGVVTIESRTADGSRFTFKRWLGFVTLWPGMQPDKFTAPSQPPLPAYELAMKGTVRFAVGVLLILIAMLAWPWLRDAIDLRLALIASTIPLCVGLSLFVHFGVFNLIAAAWRTQGVDVRTLFRDPLRSTSLTEFWSRRWNLAFVEMTTIGVYRPLRAAPGIASVPAIATVVAFLFSGVLHELAISVPAQAGYGGPLAYFVIHAALIEIEHWLENTGRAINKNAGLGRVWTIAWLILPAPILFHRPFLSGCVWPLAGIST